jgi:hypothetical protein
VRPDRDDRRVRAHRPREPEERGEPEPVPATLPGTVLALQRTAGNSAVGGLLRGAPAALVQRYRKLPEDPQSLADVAPAAAKDMAFDTDALDLGRLADWFKGPRGADREGVAVNIRFGSDFATKPDPKAEKRLRDGLAGIATAAFNLQDIATKPVLADRVRTRDLDLTPFGGPDGHFRFTCVTRKAGAKGPAEVDVIIELVHAAPALPQPWSKLTSQRRLELQNRFARAGYTQAQPTLTTAVDTWTDDQFGRVLQALEAIPESMLQAVPDIVWERGHGGKGPTGESGWFQYTTTPKERRLTLYDDAFKSDAELGAIIAHEIGHAISFKPPSEKHGSALAQSAAFKKAIKDDGGKAVTDYAKKDLDEHFADAYSLFITEPETLKALRPHVYDYLNAQQGLADKAKP